MEDPIKTNSSINMISTHNKKINNTITPGEPSNELIINTQTPFSDQHEDITHEYKLRMNSGSLSKKKIKYNNPENYDKIIHCFTNDPIIKIKTPTLILDYKSSKYIKFDITAPRSLGTAIGYIYVESRIKDKSILEEVLRFVIEIV